MRRTSELYACIQFDQVLNQTEECRNNNITLRNPSVIADHLNKVKRYSSSKEELYSKTINLYQQSLCAD